MKSYTDINQSNKLAEILPFESADMYYCKKGGLPQWIHIYENYHFVSEDIDIPCWSIAALLATLPNEITYDNEFKYRYQIDIRKYDGGDNTTLYQIAYGNKRDLNSSWHDMVNTGEKESLIDCCVQMIIELNKMNLL